MPAPLTPTQTRVLEYIAQHITHKQRPPTRREVAQHFGWASDNAADEVIQRLHQLGYVALDAAARRGGHAQRYVRVIRWPAAVPPVIHLSASPEGPAHALAGRTQEEAPGAPVPSVRAA